MVGTKNFKVEQVYFSDGFYHIYSGTVQFSLSKEKLKGNKVKKGDVVTLYFIDECVFCGADINNVRCYLDR